MPILDHTSHIVVAGDTLASIAAAFGTTADALFARNRDVLGSNQAAALRVGTPLQIGIQDVDDLGATAGIAVNDASATLVATRAEHDATRATLNALLDKLRDAGLIT